MRPSDSRAPIRIAPRGAGHRTSHARFDHHADTIDLRETSADKERLLSFGRYPDVRLADERLRRAEAKVALGHGRDPGAREAAEPVPTFEAAAGEWHADRRASLDPGHASRLMTRVERDAFRALGPRDVRSISSADVLGMVRSVEACGALDVSRRLHQHGSQIFRFWIPQAWADNDPTSCVQCAVKPRPRTPHMARVGLQDLPQLVERSTAMMVMRRLGAGRGEVTCTLPKGACCARAWTCWLCACSPTPMP